MVSDLLKVIERICGSRDGFELRSFGSLPLATHDKHSDSTEAYDICLTFHALSQSSQQSSEDCGETEAQGGEKLARSAGI